MRNAQLASCRFEYLEQTIAELLLPYVACFAFFRQAFCVHKNSGFIVQYLFISVFRLRLGARLRH